jgi:hypothetical protein
MRMHIGIYADTRDLAMQALRLGKELEVVDEANERPRL